MTDHNHSTDTALQTGPDSSSATPTTDSNDTISAAQVVQLTWSGSKQAEATRSKQRITVKDLWEQDNVYDDYLRRLLHNGLSSVDLVLKFINHEVEDQHCFRACLAVSYSDGTGKPAEIVWPPPGTQWSPKTRPALLEELLALMLGLSQDASRQRPERLHLLVEDIGPRTLKVVPVTRKRTRKPRQLTVSTGARGIP